MQTTGKVLLVSLFLLWSCALSESAFSADQKVVDDLLLAAFKAEKIGGSSAKVAEKFQAVLEADPNNYYALIKLGSMKMPKAQATNQDKKATADAIDYFLRATLARPENPDAFLYLAQLYYQLGYMTEGDRYARMANTLPQTVVYDSACLMGWRYEDTGNYYAAVMTYAPLVLGSDSKFKFDPYLLQRLYNAAFLAPPPYDWVYTVFSELLGEERSKEASDALRRLFNEILMSSPRMVEKDFVEILFKLYLRESLLRVLAGLQTTISGGVKVPERFEMPTSIYQLFFCNPEEIVSRPFTDPYDAFVRASFDPARDQDRVLSELKDLRDEALKVIADEKNDLEKAKKLFNWLKKRALVDYNALDGFSAKGVLEDKKFLCLSGSIIYTLLARDAGLKVNGVLEPGHAYASFNGDRKIRVETTTEGPEGFDYRPESTVKSHEKNRVLQLGPFATYGEVTEPMEFVAYQFSNAAAFSMYDLVLNKYEKLLRQVLKDSLHMDEARQADIISRWKTYGVVGGQENMAFRRIVRKMAAADDVFRGEVIKQLDKNIELLKTARGMSPFDLWFRDNIRTYIFLAAMYESLPAEAAAEERERKRIKLRTKKAGAERSMLVASVPGYKSAVPAEELEADAASVDAELEQLDQEEKESWDAEKKFWLKAVKRLSKAAKEFSCDDRLQTYLARMQGRVIALAEVRGDAQVMDELRAYASSPRP